MIPANRGCFKYVLLKKTVGCVIIKKHGFCCGIERQVLNNYDETTHAVVNNPYYIT